jgi:HAE1 family hydrophobic/amphiphilic exporter-1
MALGLGEGAELRAPLAVTVIGGLTVGTALTLIVIPVVYSLLTGSKVAAAVTEAADGQALMTASGPATGGASAE